MIISLIAAIGKNRELGLDNKLLWNVPEDMKNFVRLTKGKPIIVGRKTFESFKKPLPGRLNIVITRDLSFKFDHEFVRVFNDLKSALNYLRDQSTVEVVVCGGAQIYQEMLPVVDKIYLSYIDWEGRADTFFPKFNLLEFTVVGEQVYESSSSSIAWKFVEYQRK